MFNKIRVVLLHTSHPGNIGASARALKTMGLTRLYLVNPKEFPSNKATELAASAQDVLEKVVICQSLAEAVADCVLVFGTGSEARTLVSPIITPRQAAEEVMQQFQDQEVAFVFGRESHGMSNAEMQLCQKQIQIPGNAEYCSLNLAAAVQIITYELRRASLLRTEQKSLATENLASNQEMEGFYQHLETVMQKVGYYDVNKPYSRMSRLRRIFNAAQLQKKEIDLLRGFLLAIEKQ